MPQKETKKERLLKEIINLRKRSNRFFYKADSYFFATYSAICDLERECELSLEDIIKASSTANYGHSEYDSFIDMKNQILKIAKYSGKIKTLDETLDKEIEGVVKKIRGQSCATNGENEE